MNLHDEIFIYKDFVLQGKIQNFDSLIWVRRYNEIGEFTLTLPLNKQNIELIKAGNIIYKGDYGEAAYIEDIVCENKENKQGTIVVTGRFLNCILDNRVINYSNTACLKTIVNDIISENFINSDNINRNIDFLNILDSRVTTKNITVEFENKRALESIQSICKDNNTGFKIIFDPIQKCLDFTLYDGKKTDVEFSENYRNIIEQDYYYQTKNHKNTCYIKYNDNIVIFADENKGISRREVYIDGDTKLEESALEQARLHLQDYKIITTLDTVINSKSPQFIYRLDWDLGDIVSNYNELWNIRIQNNILEVTEYFDSSGTNLAVVFGDLFPTYS